MAADGPSLRDPNWPAVTAAAGARPEVDPHLYLHPRTLSRLASFDLRARMIVEGITSGQHRSPYRGVSIEFAQHRPYVSGDDLRHLDWKVYGRSDKLQVKQHHQETNLDVVVLVDSSGSMAFGSRPFAEASGTHAGAGPRGETEWTKFDHATAVAAAMGYITLAQGDRVGMVVFADEIRTIVDRTSRKYAWRQIVDTLSVHPVDHETNFERVFDQTLAKVTNRCLFVIASDFFCDIETIRTVYARLKHRGHDLIAFQLVDRAEETFDFDDPARFEGFEGEESIRIDPRAIRDDYLAAFAQHTHDLDVAARRFGFDHHTVCTHDWLGPTLASFVAKRDASTRRHTGSGRRS